MTSHHYQNPQIMTESTTTQAIRDALAAGKTSSYGIVFTDPSWYVFSKACNPEAITALLAARDGIEAAVLAERERCAALCEALTVRRRWASMAGNGQKTIEPCAIAALIREGVKSCS